MFAAAFPSQALYHALSDQTKQPAPELIKPVIEGCANHGLLVGSVGLFGNVIRVAPPLVITKAEIDESVVILDKVLGSLKL